MPEPLLMVGNFLSSTLHTRGIGEELSQQLLLRGWCIATTSHRPGRFARMTDMLGTIIRQSKRYKLAIIEVYSGTAFIWAEIASTMLRMLRKPYVLSLHGGGLPAFTKRNTRRVTRLLSHAHAVLTPSRWIASSLSPLRSDIQYIPNAIQVDDYPYRHRDKPAPLLCWLRAFHEIYQPWLAVETLASIKPEFPDAELWMIGPDNQDDSLEKTRLLINKYGLKASVKMIGGIEKKDVPSWLDQGDIFLNTTRLESFGVAVVEAAACGLPIVTTNVGELPYLWEDGVDALLVPPNDAPAMAAAVRRILTEPGLAARLSANARKKAEQFDWQIVLPQWEEVIHKAIGDGR